jgi:DNA/RNA-binding domain of Phe-tRNA-synthetase-like protein
VKLIVSSRVFDLFPDYMRGVVLAHDVNNRESPCEVIDLLRSAEEMARISLKDTDVGSHPHVSSWREVYRLLGIKPSKFRSSIESMLRRVMRGDPLPSINTLVDIGNIISLRYLIPAGGHAIDVLHGDMELRPATGVEQFIPFGSDQPEHPEPDEIIFVDGDEVMTRRWTWRQANHTLVQTDTSAIEFNLDALPPVNREAVTAAAQDMQALIKLYCEGETRFIILDKLNTSVDLFP